jgi:hypothetical protein
MEGFVEMDALSNSYSREVEEEKTRHWFCESMSGELGAVLFCVFNYFPGIMEAGGSHMESTFKGTHIMCIAKKAE